MATNTDNAPERDDGIRSLVRSALIHGLVAGVLGVLAAFVYIIVTKPYYVARMIVAPAEEEGASSLAGSVSAQAGAGRLFGSSLLGGAQVGPQMEQYLQLMSSPVVIARADRTGSLSRRLFAGEIDPATGKWQTRRPGLKAVVQRVVFGLVGRTYREQPTPDMLVRVIGEKLQVEIIKKGPLQKVSFTSSDRALALGILQNMHLASDGIMKERARISATAQVSQLERRLADAQVAEVRSALADLLAQQQKRLAVVENDLPYAVKLVQDPVAEIDPSGPRVFGSLVLGGLAGGTLGMAMFLWKRRRTLRELYS